MGMGMGKRKRRYYDSYSAVKGLQQVTRLKSELVHDWAIDDMMINDRDGVVNKKQRSRVGFVEKRVKR